MVVSSGSRLLEDVVEGTDVLVSRSQLRNRRVRGGSGDVEAAGAVFEEHQSEETLQSNGIDVWKVAGDDVVLFERQGMSTAAEF